MRLSTRGEYGLRTMASLAYAYANGPVSLAQIAKEENISLAYLEQLIRVLRQKGLVKSTRGAHGGYVLAKAPDQITVGDVIRALEGPIAPVDCASEDEGSCRCNRQSGCRTRVIWERLRDSIADTLDATTLADLIESR
jgi:Rrf2 family protein